MPQALPRIPELDRDYELVRELGRGASAIVYLARERALGRDVAVKVLRPGAYLDDEAVSRLEREARAVARLDHPNIVMLLGVRRGSSGELALVLQFVPGRTLRERLQVEGPLPFPDADRILRDVARALDHAHRREVLHRDVKPENIHLDEETGVTRLSDFGIARLHDGSPTLTLPGTAMGTPSYMSPEQVDGLEVDGRSDLYGLGLVGWEMLTGRRPWEGEGLYSVIYKQKQEDLPPIEELRPDAPERLRSAIERALRKDPAERWAGARDFLAALGADPHRAAGAAAGGLEASGREVPRVTRSPRRPVPESSRRPVPGSSSRAVGTSPRRPVPGRSLAARLAAARERVLPALDAARTVGQVAVGRWKRLRPRLADLMGRLWGGTTRAAGWSRTAGSWMRRVGARLADGADSVLEPPFTPAVVLLLLTTSVLGSVLGVVVAVAVIGPQPHLESERLGGADPAFAVSGGGTLVPGNSPLPGMDVGDAQPQTPAAASAGIVRSSPGDGAAISPRWSSEARRHARMAWQRTRGSALEVGHEVRAGTVWLVGRIETLLEGS